MNVLRGGSAEEGSGQRGGKKRYMQRHRSKSSFTEKKRRLGDTNNAAECVAGKKRGPHGTALYSMYMLAQQAPVCGLQWSDHIIY